MADEGRFIAMPIIDAAWLRRFLDTNRIVLRQPNRSYKVSQKFGDERCVAEWKNVFKIRRLSEIYLEHDMSQSMMQVDEKPIHMNESGSKLVKTLHLQGAPFIALRTNHSATRPRFTIMTSAFSSKAAAEDEFRPPLAVCIKAASGERRAGLTLPEYMIFVGCLDQLRVLRPYSLPFVSTALA